MSKADVRSLHSASCNFFTLMDAIVPHMEVRKISLARKNLGIYAEIAQKGWHMTDNLKAALLFPKNPDSPRSARFSG